jgi:monoamine oxidase
MRTRRDILKVLGAAAAASALPSRPVRAGTPQPSSGPRAAATLDTVIVGAGFAGMTAARRLVKEGRRVVVVEARDRVGGRVKGGTIAGRDVDLGGMWAGPTQTRVLAALEEFGLHKSPQRIAGRQIVDLAGRRWLADGEAMGFEPAVEKEIGAITDELNRMAATLPADAPWSAPRAAEWDAISAQEWLFARSADPLVRAYWDTDFRSVLEADLSRLSLLFLLFYIRSGDSIDALFGYEEGAQAFLVKEGMHGLAEKLAAVLGDRIVLSAPVRSIAQDPSGVVVRSEGREWRAATAIVAMPPPLTVRLAWVPPLPSGRDLLAQRMPMGSVIKWYVAYDRPFWRDRGLNALVVTDRPPCVVSVDAAKDDTGPALLAGFIDTPYSLKYTGRPQEERRAAVTGWLQEFFGPEAARPIAYLDQDWPSEVWSRGCYGASMGPTVMTAFGRFLREPHGRVHWAGTETSDRWSGYIDGAIRSGERAAAEVLARLA